MIRIQFSVLSEYGDVKTITAGAHCQEDMWHDLAEKVAAQEKIWGCSVHSITFLDDVSKEE